MLKKQFKGSLLERIFLGEAVFPRVNAYRAMPPRKRRSLFFDNAQMNVFAYKVEDHAFDITEHEENPQFHPAAQRSFFKHLKTYSNFFKNLRCTTRWNILAWIEFVALYWLNEATFRHKPLEQTFAQSFISSLNIIAAYLFNGFAKTINLIGTPIALVLLGVMTETLGAMALAKGVSIGLFVMAGLSGIAFGFGLYYAYAYLTVGKEGSKKAIDEMFDIKNASSSLLLGLFTPMIRAIQSFKSFYHEHPVAAAASFLLGFSVVLMATILPNAGVTPVLGFEIHGMLLGNIAKTLTIPSTDPVSMKILSKAVIGALSFGIMDICIRATKEICAGFKLRKKPHDPLPPMQQNVTSLSRRASAPEASTTRLIGNKLTSTFPNLDSAPSGRHKRSHSL